MSPAITKPVASETAAPAAKAKKAKKAKKESNGTRVSRVDVLQVLQSLGAKNVPTPRFVSTCEKRGIPTDAALRHVFHMRTMDDPLISAIKHEGKGNEHEEITITKAGLAVLKG